MKKISTAPVLAAPSDAATLLSPCVGLYPKPSLGEARASTNGSAPGGFLASSADSRGGGNFSRHPSSQRFHDILAELGALHDKKQADYGRADNPFANFHGSTEWGVTDWLGVMIRATDKLRRLQSFARTGKLHNEGVIDSLDDLAVYAIIARVLFEQAEESPRNA